MTIYRLDVLLSQFGTSLLFHDQFCHFLTCIQISQEAGMVVVIYIVKGFSLVNETEVDVFLELSSFFYDPMDVGNLTSGSSAFSRSSLYIWKF